MHPEELGLPSKPPEIDFGDILPFPFVEFHYGCSKGFRFLRHKSRRVLFPLGPASQAAFLTVLFLKDLAENLLGDHLPWKFFDKRNKPVVVTDSALVWLADAFRFYKDRREVTTSRYNDLVWGNRDITAPWNNYFVLDGELKLIIPSLGYAAISGPSGTEFHEFYTVFYPALMLFIGRNSFHWRVEQGDIFLTCRQNSAIGVPPTAVDLFWGTNLWTLRARIRDRLDVEPIRGMVNSRDFPCIALRTRPGEEGEQWEADTTLFLAVPCARTFELLVKNRDVYVGLKDLEVGNKRGKGKATSKVVAIVPSLFSYAELAQAVKAEAGTNVTVQFCLLMKLESQLITIRGGQDTGKLVYRA
jgi:hypothetical protein